FRYTMSKLDEKTMNEKSKEAEKLLDYMSDTIEDFRNFFKPEKEKKEFNLKESLDNVLGIIGKTIINQNISIKLDIEKNIIIFGYKNELEQVILNILSNAKEALIQTNRKNPYITIIARKEKNRFSIHIDDNGGGINIKPIEKIFEPYISSKSDANGTGIGLYMSKIIIEKNMNGKLKAQNTRYGARFSIIIAKMHL
ncbi:MAG: HAMP domain-containing histidine kinase, partial [Campylobacteraceae bacterium]|nr:HAMP domain-containing histidine kinase [Campylobacteraceae bacterium]